MEHLSGTREFANSMLKQTNVHDHLTIEIIFCIYHEVAEF